MSALKDLNGETRNKRKTSPVSFKNRPSKILKAELSYGTTNGEGPASGESEHIYMSESMGDMPVVPAAQTPEWQAMVERVVKSVVSIHFCQTSPFDTDDANSSEATGFVVDAEKGFILTNRHVCFVSPTYRDPVHDFGILRFDPKQIKYLTLSELPLRPDLAKIGAEIRILGNDAGEKLSILSGVISRLDRNAPAYGEGYNDFNTNYIQAAAAASGGSSGSPVVNINGHAVALQAGGRSDGAATDYFLPLDRPLRVLKCIQEGKPVTRGTIQTQWVIEPFDQCRRLGLSAEHEAAIRKGFPTETGLLVAETVLPEGPADGKLEEGDVLIKVNGEILTQFIALEDILDSNVGGKVKILIQRGGNDIEVEIEIGDLHSITPDRFVSVTGASFHDLSYQQARYWSVPVKGVFVSKAAGTFHFDHSVPGYLVDSVDQKKTPNLDTFIEVMNGIPDRKRVVVTYKHLRDPHTLNTRIVRIDRHWHPKMTMAIRNDKTGLWDFHEIGKALPALPPERRKAEFARLETTGHEAATDVVRSFVKVSCTSPLKLDGFPRTRRVGYGLVINAEKGLVVVSRAIVPYDLCDISCTVADKVIVDARVRFLHPIANYAVVQYDASLVDAPVKSAKLATERIKQGASTMFIGWNQNLRPVAASTTVTEITTVAIPSNRPSPRYRATNVEAITIDTSLSNECGSGVLVNEDGTVEALWLTYMGDRATPRSQDTLFHLGLATPVLLPVLDQVEKGLTPSLRILNIETIIIDMAQAGYMGVADDWIEKVAASNRTHHQLFMVRKVDCAIPSGIDDDAFKEGDVILTLNDRLITRASEFDVMYHNEHLDALVVRNKETLRLKVPTISTEDLETDRAIIFCGAVIYSPHHAVRQQISKLHSEVYVGARTQGSPSVQYGLGTTSFITAVNDSPTPTLTEFLAAVNVIPDNTYFRLRVTSFDNNPWVATMKKNEHYFPTVEYTKDASEPNGWKVTTWAERYGVADGAGDIMDEG